MKLLSYKLNNWKAYGSSTCKYPNWYRVYDDPNHLTIYIGLIRQHDDNVGPRQTWRLDYDFAPKELRDLVDLIPFDKEYYEEELDQAKQDVDNLIMKVNKLKCFI